MIYIAFVLVAALLFIRYAGPKTYAVHASAVRELPEGVRAEGHEVPRFVRNQDGGYFDIDHRFVGRAVGNSMSTFDLPDGTKFVGDYLSAEDRRSLPRGAVVVVESEPNASDLCLRRVDQITEDGHVTFLPDSYGNNHAAQPLDEVKVRVTHAIKPATLGPLPAWIDRLVGRSAA